MVKTSRTAKALVHLTIIKASRRMQMGQRHIAIKTKARASSAMEIRRTRAKANRERMSSLVLLLVTAMVKTLEHQSIDSITKIRT